MVLEYGRSRPLDAYMVRRHKRVAKQNQHPRCRPTTTGRRLYRDQQQPYNIDQPIQTEALPHTLRVSVCTFN